ncbi:SDR family NAD(P)-dependent oxidoreductase [Brenneria corticis]|uniref:Short-chain dehydrogenase n=1 Tax=Brenneria corticis TaxID=2173106 RepID=A0A2U1TR62_9GAMM|nr:SDR family oxidoreductase [Brenneria sp. CFCC 11842]PWC11891.1 short-chain dehydrogenase [Brenneria sp. CFCC 11842]
MRIALVVGGAGGLGRAAATRFAQDGMTVVIADLDGDVAEKLAATLPGQGHCGISFNIADEASVIAGFEYIEQKMGPVAVLAQFAGIIGAGGAGAGISLADATVEDWDRVQSVNARGTFLCIREMARRRRRLAVEHGRIITISSGAGQLGSVQSGVAYSSSKATIIGLTRVAARELAPLGITVNTIAPGPIDTPMLSLAINATGEQRRYSSLDAVPLRRIGEPDEIAAAASYLASPEAGYVTGTTLDVNGGIHMH